MHRLDIINCLIKKYNFETYLEIGISNGWVLNRVNAKNKVGVDPDWRVYINQAEFPLRYDSITTDNWTPHVPYGQTTSNITIICQESETFFNALHSNVKFDIVFIDGLHVRDQVFKDITNAMKHLNENGVIVVHDCSPHYEHEAQEVYSGGNWNGNVYLGYLDAIQTYNLEHFTVETDWGCGVLFPKNVNFNVERHRLDLSWDEFEKNRRELLNLISITEFIDIIDN